MLCLDQRQDATLDSTAPKASSLLEGQRPESDIERVYADIFDAVMDRRLLPGAKLTEAALCNVFECSRSTVRGALAQLAHDKIVVLLPHRGAFVRQPEASEIADVFDTRRVIECLLIDKLLAQPDLAQRLQPLYEMVRLERAAFDKGDRISWLRLSNAFHVKMAQLAGSQVLTELMHSLCSRTTLIIAYHDMPRSSTCSYAEHEQILDLLCAHNREGAVAAMQHHLQDCEQRVHQPRTAALDPWSVFGVKRYNVEPS